MSGHGRFTEPVVTAFRARYGLDEEAAWTDAQLDAALADNGYPPLATLPGEARGMMVGMESPSDTPDRWRRVNAGHLLGHAMIHGGGRCGGCADW